MCDSTCGLAARAVDTSVRVRWPARDDPTQTAAADVAVARRSCASGSALVQALRVLQARDDRNVRLLVAMLELPTAHESTVPQDADTVAAAIAAFGARPTPGSCGGLLLEIARKAGQLLPLTLDRTLGRLEATRRLRNPAGPQREVLRC